LASIENFVHGKMKRCNVADALDSNNKPIVNAYYGDTGYADDGSNGQVMVEIPKFWYKKTLDTSGDRLFTFAISDEPKTDYVVHPAFYRDRDGDGTAEEVDYRYFSAYLGYNNGGLLESKSGVTPTADQTIGTFRTQAEDRGVGWGLADYNLVYAIQILYLTEYGDFDSQTTIGRGFVDGNSSATTTGGTSSYGNDTHGETTGTEQMSYRGIEDFWGNLYYWVDGIVSDSNYDILIGNEGFNDSGTGYTLYSTTNSSNTYGYIDDIQPQQETGFSILSGGGSDSTYLYDYGSLSSGKVALFGGSWDNGSDAGAFLLRLSFSASSSYADVGARLAL